MKKSKTDKRTRLIEAANTLVQQQGFNQTTLADIALKSKVPLGNVYYYFKTKDDIGHALIEHRTDCSRGRAVGRKVHGHVLGDAGVARSAISFARHGKRVC
ncbi:MAG: TetR/AcrR family transcriptional regulator [Nitrospirae bacterium]|nr:TetR/AcrR family transcriptional regulator [Nitrospirota bacterium]